MADVLVLFVGPVSGPDGVAYTARVCGGPAENGLWQGWIEFIPDGGSPTLRTGWETEQLSREDLHHWATGLTLVYLQGALNRALHEREALEGLGRSEAPAAEGPPPTAGRAGRGRRSARPRRVPAPPHAVLDPFEVYPQGEGVLRKELGALSVDHLENIIRAYGLEEAPPPPGTRSEAELVEAIIAAMRQSATTTANE
jgi:hypothetical protein